jgi:hypothetical protein
MLMITGEEAVQAPEDATPLGLKQSWKPWSRVMLTDVAEIFQHTLAFLAAIFSIWIVHLVLVNLLGVEAKFYDRIPVRYVIDSGHLAVLVRFVWKLITQIGSRR